MGFALIGLLVGWVYCCLGYYVLFGFMLVTVCIFGGSLVMCCYFGVCVLWFAGLAFMVI